MRLAFSFVVAVLGISSAANALVLTYAQRAARLVDPGNSFFVYDERTNDLGSVALNSFSRGNQVTQYSNIAATAAEIRVDAGLSEFASMYATASNDLAQAETWLTFDFSTFEGTVVDASFRFKRTTPVSASSPLEHAQAYLLDITTGEFVFNFYQTDSWTGSLTAGHAYHYFGYAFADAIPTEVTSPQFSALINETALPPPPSQIPLPDGGLLLVTGLGLNAILRRRRGFKD